MKTILSTVLVVMISLGTYASHDFRGQRETKIPASGFSVEFLDVSPGFRKIDNETIEINSAFLVRQHDSTFELFGAFWARFETGEGTAADVYPTKNWQLMDIRLAESLSLDEEVQIKAVSHTLRSLTNCILSS